MKVKKTLMEHDHQMASGRIQTSMRSRPLMPQVPKEEIKAIIQHTRE